MQLDGADFGERMLRALCAVAQPPVRRGVFQQGVAPFCRERGQAGEAGQNEHEAADNRRAGFVEQIHTLIHGSHCAALQQGGEECVVHSVTSGSGHGRDQATHMFHGLFILSSRQG